MSWPRWQEGLTLVDAALPAYARAISRSLVVGRLLAWLVAAVAGLHGSSLILASLVAGRATPLARDAPGE